jgi:hypothetical protein
MKNLEIFNSSVDRAHAIVITYFVLHNYCEMWKIPKLGHVNDLEVIGYQLWKMENKQNKIKIDENKIIWPMITKPLKGLIIHIVLS